MHLTGQLTDDDKGILGELPEVCSKLEAELFCLPQGLVKDVAIQLYYDVSDIPAAIIILCQQPRTSSRVSCVLLRTLIESCLSVFAFCQDPDERAKLYWNFNAVLDWKFVCRDEQHIGCPLVPDTPERTASMAARKQSASELLEQYGEAYLSRKKGGSPEELLTDALTSGNGKPQFFRDRWYPETRAEEILQRENMGWVYDVLYRRLCSAVHSDSSASKILVTSRSSMFSLACQFWGAAMYKLVERFRLHLSAPHKGVLRLNYTGLQGKTSG